MYAGSLLMRNRKLKKRRKGVELIIVVTVGEVVMMMAVAFIFVNK